MIDHSNEHEDQTWVKSAISGNMAAFEQLYSRHHQRLFLYAKRMTGSVQEAEDVVQDTFIRTWQKLDSFRAESQFYTWLRKVASRILIDRMRVKNAKVWRESAEFEDIHFVTDSNSGAQLDLEKFISQLPEGARSVFVMHDIEGYTHDEISGLANIAAGTSKAQLFRARKLLRDRL